jgi:hypothetical protein
MILKKRICYLVSHGFAARMLLHSDLVGELNRNGIEIVVLSKEASGSAFGIIEQKGRLSFVEADYTESKLTHGQLSEIRRYLREPIEDNAALWSRHLYNQNSAKKWIRVRAWVALKLHRAASRLPMIRKLFEFFDRRIHHSSSLRSQFQSIQPDAVVSTYPVSSFESACLLEAQKLGIPTIGHLLSWDNITCKGKFISVPEHFIAWGPIMKQELIEHYAILPKNIYECGVPHFDQHLKLISPAVKKSELEHLGLDPRHPYLFFGMSAPIFAPHEIDIVEWLSKKVTSGEFGVNMQLVIRPHPQNVSGNMADQSWLPRLKALRSKHVGLNLPKISDSKLAWNMDLEDLKIMVNLLAGCSICLNSGSTLSIDALFHDKPVIVTMFDADQVLPWCKSARRIRDYPHYAKLLATKAIKVADNYALLTSQIKDYISCPGLDSERRHAALKLECGEPDGQSVSRVAKGICSILTNDSEKAQ